MPGGQGAGGSCCCSCENCCQLCNGNKDCTNPKSLTITVAGITSMAPCPIFADDPNGTFLMSPNAGGNACQWDYGNCATTAFWGYCLRPTRNFFGQQFLTVTFASCTMGLSVCAGFGTTYGGWRLSAPACHSDSSQFTFANFGPQPWTLTLISSPFACITLPPTITVQCV